MRSLIVLLMAMVICVPAIAEPSADAFQRCAACHLATGEGIPGAFPPLKNRVANIAATAEGRVYLVAVVNVGLMGSITVDGMPYMGVMPAQGALYDAQGISDVLNYSVQVIDAENVAAGWLPYTAAEVESLLAAGSASNGQESMKLRNSLMEQRPELQ
jgi:hypothetical protein